MGVNISNPSADRNDKIANAAKVIGKSKDRKKVFLAVYTGKKKVKTVTDILNSSGLRNKVRVLQEAKKLASEDIIIQLDRINNETAYKKIDFYTHNKKAIIRLVEDRKKLEKFPTKVNPRINTGTVKVEFPKNLVKIKQVYIDDIDSFSKVRKVDENGKQLLFYERDIKEGLKKIIGEVGNFTDWGGENNDLFSTKINFKRKRMNVAFGLKGKGTQGKLTPKKMGKNGDQIQRLFKSPADIFIVQYNGQIDESIIDQMKSLAIAKSVMENKMVYYGVIDGKDTLRLVEAYSDCFN